MKIPLKKEAQLHHIHFDPPETKSAKEFADFTASMTFKIGARVAELQDRALCEAIMDYAAEQGFTDLYLIDEEFVKSAIINEIKRRTGGI